MLWYYDSHELRESVRDRRLGFPTGAGDDYELWNNAHTATLQDYIGADTVAMEVFLAESLEVGQLAITPMKIRRQGRLGLEDTRALVSREFAEVNC